MTHVPSLDQPPPEAVLADDTIDLSLIRALSPENRAARPPEAWFLAPAGVCRYAIGATAGPV